MTTTTYAWPDTRQRAIQAFNGDTPGDTIEATVLTHFKDHPARVHTLIETIGRRVTQGQVRSGWAILAHELEQRPADIRATDNTERKNHIRLAEQWIRNTGGYIDRPDELHDALFGPHGRLHPWKDDQQLVTLMLHLWTQQRPRFQKAEQETRDRHNRTAATLHRVRKATTTDAIGTVEADAHAKRITAEIERARTATQPDLEYLEQIAPDNDE